VTRTATTVTVTITGRSATVVPGLRPLIEVTLSGPVERIVDETREFTISEASSGGN
jgi:hypothetical protein